MSENSDDLPPARARSRTGGHGEPDRPQQPGADAVAHTESGQTGDQEPDAHEVIVTPIRSAFRLADYVSKSEDRDTLSKLLEGLEQSVSPRDFLERIWMDEIVGLEWEAHRLRAAKKALLEKGMTEALGHRWVAKLGMPKTAEEKGGYKEAAAAVEGDESARFVMRRRLGEETLNDDRKLAASGYLATINGHLDLERVILACGQRRDTILTRLYGRRELLESKAAKAQPNSSRSSRSSR